MRQLKLPKCVVTQDENIVHEEGKDYAQASTGDIRRIEWPEIMPEQKFLVVEEQVVQHRVLSKAEAEQAVLNLFRERKELDYTEIISELGLDLRDTIDICRELEEKGKIKAITR